ncbi:NUDIX domain-containing protein [Streptomyces bluensis]|uniref:NUDIX domain-containing protein n=1 Tax=Streptomyces bluensis TaxID=33897 RepID=UPI00369E1804
MKPTPTPADPDAWNAYLAEGNATQARKRVAADVLLRDSSGRVLLVNPTYKPGWDLPGGMAEANEPPEVTVVRELREELGLEVVVRSQVRSWRGRWLRCGWAFRWHRDAPRAVLVNTIDSAGNFTHAGATGTR